MERTLAAGIPAFVLHEVKLPVCCPVSANPRPGSTLEVAYFPFDRVMPVEDLTEMVSEYVDGHASGVRNMEEMIQDLAQRVSRTVGVRVRARANLVIQPPYGGDEQRMRVTARAKP